MSELGSSAIRQCDGLGVDELPFRGMRTPEALRDVESRLRKPLTLRPQLEHPKSFKREVRLRRRCGGDFEAGEGVTWILQIFYGRPPLRLYDKGTSGFGVQGSYRGLE